MWWRSLRPILLPLLREIVGDTAPLFLDPCCRAVWWQRVAIRRRLRGKKARWATWRFEILRVRCRVLVEPGRCDAARAFDEAIARAVIRRLPVAEELVSATAYQLRNVSDLLGPLTRAALNLDPVRPRRD